MPSKALFYRFLNTIIDDLFSFIITMPTLHRISCFRDDVIFLIYLYQRWAYRVDKTRGPYGSKEDEKVDKKVGEIKDDVKEVTKEELNKESKTITTEKSETNKPYKRKNKKHEENKDILK